MIKHSNAYLTIKSQNQELLDFTVLCCQAIPALKGYMKAVEKGGAEKLPDADYFNKGEPNFEQLRKTAGTYKKTLGKMLLLSTFSYFELYFKTLLKEIIEFDNLHSKLKGQQSNNMHDNQFNQLREYRKKHLKARYQKFSQRAHNHGFVFPSDRFAMIGVEFLSQKIDDLKANDIPIILEKYLGLTLSEQDKNQFNKYRNNRNEIAHGGKNISIEFNEGIEACKFFRNLTMTIDSYIVSKFFILEES